MRRAFTLLEIMVVVGIAGVMAAVAVVSISRGQSGARIKGATRDVFATIRRARSVALVTQQPAIITYSTRTIDGEPVASIEINSSKLMSSDGVRTAQTLAGDTVTIGADADDPPETAGSGDPEPAADGVGETMEEILFSRISDDVVRGVVLKVTVGDESLEFDRDVERAKSKISVFSNVDYLLGRFTAAKAEAEKKQAAEEEEPESASGEETQEPVSVVWEVNGRCEPHRVWIYPKGSTPERGLSIKVDRFGAAKVVGGEERD